MWIVKCLTLRRCRIYSSLTHQYSLCKKCTNFYRPHLFQFVSNYSRFSVRWTLSKLCRCQMLLRRIDVFDCAPPAYDNRRGRCARNSWISSAIEDWWIHHHGWSWCLEQQRKEWRYDSVLECHQPVFKEWLIWSGAQCSGIPKCTFCERNVNWRNTAGNAIFNCSTITLNLKPQNDYQPKLAYYLLTTLRDHWINYIGTTSTQKLSDRLTHHNTGKNSHIEGSYPQKWPWICTATATGFGNDIKIRKKFHVTHTQRCRRLLTVQVLFCTHCMYIAVNIDHRHLRLCKKRVVDGLGVGGHERYDRRRTYLSKSDLLKNHCLGVKYSLHQLLDPSSMVPGTTMLQF